MAKIQSRVGEECANKARRKCAWNRIGNTMLRLHCTWRGRGRGCTINVNIEWCGKWAANWMQFKHLSLERVRDKRVSLLQLCFFGGHPATARWWRQVRGRPRCICNMCVQTPSASSALSPPPSSLAASVNDHELRQSRSLCRSCSHDLMHYA